MKGARAESVPRVLMGIRDMVAQGDLRPGDRVTELAVSARLNLSRTPVRTALVKLQEEGLLDALPGGGFAVAAFSHSDVLDTIEMRGTLEGLAARLAAERGVTEQDLTPLSNCLAHIDAALADPDDARLIAVYAEQNAMFHVQLATLCRSAPVRRQIERIIALPFASPNALVAMAGVRSVFTIAQHQHRALLEAIGQGQGARAESLAREHARIAIGNLAPVFAAGEKEGVLF